MKKIDTIFSPFLWFAVCICLFSEVAVAQVNGHYEVANLTSLQKKAIRKSSNPNISLKLKKVPLSKALEMIADQAEAGLYYNASLLTSKKITLDLDNIPLSKALRMMLNGTNLEAVSEGRNIVLRKKKQNKQQMTAASIAEMVRGKVTDASTGEALPSVNISVMSTTQGTFTDRDGNYSLEVELLQDTLVFSFVGYQRKVVPIEGRTMINVELSTQILTGNETIVVGYGTQERHDVTGSISTVSQEDIENTPASNISEVLAGKVPGVYTAPNSGQPGQAQALTYLNQVRERARNTPPKDPERSKQVYVPDPDATTLADITTTNQDELRDIIWHERRVELALEGWRRDDLLRQERFGDVMRDFAAQYDTPKGENFMDGRDYLLPITQSEIDNSNGTITQNPNY